MYYIYICRYIIHTYVTRGNFCFRIAYSGINEKQRLISSRNAKSPVIMGRGKVISIDELYPCKKLTLFLLAPFLLRSQVLSWYRLISDAHIIYRCVIAFRFMRLRIAFNTAFAFAAIAYPRRYNTRPTDRPSILPSLSSCMD